jgi:YD repeat-containing protein
LSRPPPGVTTCTYDPNGKIGTIAYPNGTVADHEYDDLGRLVTLENRKSDLTVIDSFAYTLDDAGNRTQIDEVRLRQGSGGIYDTRGLTYAYDDLNRLLSETIAAPAADPISHTYAYDAVGNRETKESCTGDPVVCETTTYVYNDNNQLISETDSGGATNYFYDSNGNTVEKSDSVDTTTYGYDYRNLLIEAVERFDEEKWFPFVDSNIIWGWYGLRKY